MSPERKSSTAILAGQIASALIGFALGVVVTLLVIVDWAPATARPAPNPPVVMPAPVAAAAPAVPPSPPAAAPPPAENAAAAPPPAPVPAPPPAPVAAPVVAPVVAPVPPPPAAQAAAAPPPPQAPAAEPPAPAPAPKPPRPRPKPAEPSASRARYVVQAGAFVSEEIAGKVATRLSEHDRQAEVLVRTDDSGRAWNVVRLTEIFATRGEAERTAAALKRNDEVDTLIIRLPPAQPDEAAKSADKPGEQPMDKHGKPAVAGAPPP